jgi:hypothetical protein
MPGSLQRDRCFADTRRALDQDCRWLSSINYCLNYQFDFGFAAEATIGAQNFLAWMSFLRARVIGGGIEGPFALLGSIDDSK